MCGANGVAKTSPKGFECPILGDDWGQEGVRLFHQGQLDPELAQTLAVRPVAALTHLPTAPDQGSVSI